MIATATDVKNRFGEFMDKAQIEPVTVEKTGRRYAVLIGFDEYMRLRALEDAYWGEAAAKAEASGYVGTDEAAKLLGAK
ncbi:MAG TPA: type II toxin-antitoxin system prevent-host-death family antitoxin [Chthonomonadaceae bacterium]|nr:type II toxin-antitoxin system prevent-host-death family antitoxin [Chthonomonadaceae bacterium]